MSVRHARRYTRTQVHTHAGTHASRGKGAGGCMDVGVKGYDENSDNTAVPVIYQSYQCV